jgi:prepilin-type N-terminal cleavage/methylation domain-containing protein
MRATFSFPAAARALRSSAPRSEAGFTLVETLAALMLIAIIVPVAMQGLAISNRAGILGQRKAAAMRVADRILNELIVTNAAQQAGTTGVIADGDVSYPWSLTAENWSEDAMTLLTVQVTFTVQGENYTVSASTLHDPTAATTGGTTTGTQ